MFSVAWILTISIVIILFAVIKYSNSGGLATPYPQAADKFQKEVARLNNANLTTLQIEQKIKLLGSMPVRVDGVVKDVRPKPGYDYTDLDLIVDVAGFGAVSCIFSDKKTIARAQGLNKGQKVKVVGKISERSFPQPMLFEARLA